MNIYKDFLLKDILYYHIGGKARIVAEINSKKDFFDALSFFKKEGIEKIMPVGLGSNLLFTDNTFDGAILWFHKSSSLIFDKDDVIQAFSSVALDDAIALSFSKNLAGLEWAGGLPGTVGACLRGNVGAFGHEIRESIYQAEIFNIATGQRQILSKQELNFSYRQSLIKQNKNLIVVSVTFLLKKVSKEQIDQALKTYQSCIEHRQKNNPMDYPSCGSVFKNITDKENIDKILKVWPDIQDSITNVWHNKISMGYVIKRLGFSNFKIGGALVSDKHSNFIINVDNASFSDVFSIIEKIKKSFSDNFGFLPETEVEIIS